MRRSIPFMADPIWCGWYTVEFSQKNHSKSILNGNGNFFVSNEHNFQCFCYKSNDLMYSRSTDIL